MKTLFWSHRSVQRRMASDRNQIKREFGPCAAFVHMILTKRRRAKHRDRYVAKGDSDTTDSSSDEDEKPYCHAMNNKVYFYNSVSKRNVLDLVKNLEKASDYAVKNCDNIKDARVYLYIQSSGGDAHAGLSAMDHIRNNRVPVTTIADGFVASAATFLLLGGEQRVGMQHATILIHQLRTGFWGKYTELVDDMNNSTAMMAMIKKIYVENTSWGKEEFKKKLDTMLKQEIYMSMEESLRYGVVWEIW